MSGPMPGFPRRPPGLCPSGDGDDQLIADQLVENDIASPEEIDLHLANVAAGRLDLTQPPMIAAWGRRRI